MLKYAMGFASLVSGLELEQAHVRHAAKSSLRLVHDVEGTGAHRSFVRNLAFRHRLRVCNAYPYDKAVDVYRGNEKLTEEKPLSYKQCEDFKAQLKAGDKLQFKVGDSNAGTFSVSDLPNNDAVLLLVMYRHDTLSTAVSFESHVFANLLNAQIAVIDTYKGAQKGKMKIQDHDSAKTARSEELRYDSVVAVNPGKYDCILTGQDHAEVAKQGLVALNRESYVILRVGVDAKEGNAFPPEVVVFPQSDEALLGGAMGYTVLLALLVTMFH